MTNSVTFPVNLGGDGSTVTDDDNASTGLGNGGHRTRFVPAMGQIVAVANTLTQRLAEQSDTSTTSLTIATGSKSFVTAGFYEWAVGMYVVAASTSSPANRMYGQVTSWTTSTNTLVVNVLAIDGSGTFSSWTVSLSGPPNLTTLPNVISVNSTTDALRITQLGTGNALLVEDSSNPDATPFVIDANGNLGLGVTPSAWGMKAFELTGGSLASNGADDIRIFANSYFNGTSFIYKATGAATQYLGSQGQHRFYVAGNGTAGNAIPFTQAMTLDASGNLGIGTTSPGFKFEAGVALGGSIAVRPTVASANALQTSLRLYGHEYVVTSRYVEIGCYNGGGSDLNSLTFSTGYGTTVAERARIDSSGNLLVGMTSPGFSQNGFNATLNQGANIWGVGVGGNSASSSLTGYSLYSTSGSAYKFYVQYSGNIYATSTTITAISDQRLKENIRDLDDGLSTILALKPRKFDWKEGKGKDIKDDRGFIAQEFEQVFPDLIDTWKDKPPEGEEPYKSVRPDLIPVLVKAIQEIAARLDVLEAK